MIPTPKEQRRGILRSAFEEVLRFTTQSESKTSSFAFSKGKNKLDKSARFKMVHSD